MPVEHICRSILVLRGHKALLDEHLSGLYGVTTSALVQAVKRNMRRFPKDFLFQLTAAEWAALRSQSVISTPPRGGRRYAPYAFTEQGVAMLSSVLALLRQHQRAIKTVRRGGCVIEYIEVALADIALANELAHEVLGRSPGETGRASSTSCCSMGISRPPSRR